MTKDPCLTGALFDVSLIGYVVHRPWFVLQLPEVDRGFCTAGTGWHCWVVAAQAMTSPGLTLISEIRLALCRHEAPGSNAGAGWSTGRKSFRRLGGERCILFLLSREEAFVLGSR